ncbi:MAG: hypothetical protein IPI24_07330 [Ignavibacteria bacterium]|nr:hypothetical protein [Ignavibacteria bacterium]
MQHTHQKHYNNINNSPCIAKHARPHISAGKSSPLHAETCSRITLSLIRSAIRRFRKGPEVLSPIIIDTLHQLYALGMLRP